MVWLCKVDVLPGQASLSHPAARLVLWLLLQHLFPNVQKTNYETSSIVVLSETKYFSPTLQTYHFTSLFLDCLVLLIQFALPAFYKSDWK